MSVEQHRRAAPVALRFAVVTISDTRELATDSGGALLVELVTAAGHAVTLRALVKDEAAPILAAVRGAVARSDVDLVLCTGGTGLAPRDVTDAWSARPAPSG